MLRAVVCAAVLVTAARVSHAEPEDPACNGKVDGHVVDASTHEPVAAATVRIENDLLATTDDAGRFVLADLCPREVRIIVERDDYKPSEKALTIVSGKDVAVEVEMLTSGEVIEIRDKAPPPPEMRSEATIDAKKLEESRGKSFTAALAAVPGVSELRSSTGVAKPIIRGQFGRRLLLLVDEVRHRAQEWGLDHAPEIDPFTAGKIRVVRGPGGVRYGSDAIGGVVLVDPPELRKEPGTNGELHLIGQSNGLGGAIDARVQNVLSAVPALSTTLEGTFKRIAAARAPDYALDNTGAEDWSAGATVGYKLKLSDYKLSYRHYEAELGVCSCLRVHNVDDFLAQARSGQPIGADEFTADFAIDRPKQHVAHDLALARASWELEHRGTLTATYSFQRDLRREYDVVRNPDTAGAQFNFRLMTHELSGLFEHNPIHLNEHWHLRGSAGVDGLAQINEYYGLNLIPDFRAYGAGAFATERLVGHTVELELGARYDFLARTASIQKIDFQRLVRSGQLAADACGAEIDPALCASRYHTFTGSAGAMWRFAEPWALKGDLSIAQRAPNSDEQYINGAAPTFPVLALGKPDIGPETTYASSVTLGYTAEDVKAEASAYVNLINDYIYFAPAVDAAGMPVFDVTIRGTFPRFITKPIDALFYGADGGIEWAPVKQLELGFQGSLVRGKERGTGSPLVFVPADHYRASVTYHPPDGGGLENNYVTVTGQAVARKTSYDIAADFIPPPHAYFLLGAEIGTELSVADQRVRFALQGANLTNARYRDYTSLMRYFADEPGWQVWLRMSLFFDSTKKGS